jgi:hypothetical protein
MAKEYAPKLFLRQAQIEMLHEYFVEHRELTNVDWENLEETGVDPIYDAWQELSVQVQEEVERDFRNIYDLASEDGIRTLIEEGRFHDVDLSTELEAHDGFLSKTFWVFLRHPRILEVAHLLYRTDRLSQRYWRKRKTLPKKQPDLSPTAIAELEAAISVYYREKQGRGKYCKVDKYLRGDRYHYLFAYPQDYTDTFIGYSDDGRLERRLQNPAFEVIFIYDPVDGTLDLYAQGDKSIKEDLQQIFARAILHEELGEENRKSVPYELNGLKNLSFAFPTEPADRVSEVKVKELRLSIIGNPKRKITYEVDPRGSREEIHELIAEALHQQNVPLSMFNVSSAVIQMRFDTNGNGKAKTLSFRISYPDSCNLKDKTEHMTAKKYLKKWGLERV